MDIAAADRRPALLCGNGGSRKATTGFPYFLGTTEIPYMISDVGTEEFEKEREAYADRSL